MNKILLVDDDLELTQLLTEILTLEGFDVTVAEDGEEGLLRLAEQAFDLVLLDVMMPRLNGFAMLTRLRKTHDTPVLMLTARGDSQDRVNGLEAGADDYLVKPFDVDELDARLRALLRRAAGRASPTIRYGDIEVDPAARTVVQGGKPVEMSPREFSVLLVLLQARGRVLSRQQLEERLYSWQSAIESNAVEVHIHHLRRKLGSSLIQTVRGTGYRLEAA